MTARFRPVLLPLTLAAASLALAGCHRPAAPPSAPPASPAVEAAQANALFLNQKTFDPWVLETTDQDSDLPFYASNGQTSYLMSAKGDATTGFRAGSYRGGQLRPLTPLDLHGANGVGLKASPTRLPYRQQLDMRTGQFSTANAQKNGVVDRTLDDEVRRDWPHIWQTSDIVISDDPEAQQVTHANLFYLLSSTYPGSDHSIPPMGLSSDTYGGHIFWDAEMWMMPALLVQHPDYARSVIDYRFKTLGQARKNAALHHFKGAEYAWESADTGAEEAPAEFARERHITADIGWAAWQYYLWTGDKGYLAREGGPLLTACADYWVSRVTPTKDGKYHVNGVLGPDESAGLVDDDAYTNGVVRACLNDAGRAARALGRTPDPRWAVIARGLVIPRDPARNIPSGSARPLMDHFAAKQADTLLLLYPLNAPFGDDEAGRMLDFYVAHTIKNGPAMTASMEAIVAARLGRPQQALDLFHDSYRPFLRGPWDAFAEKRTSNRVYFCTGMGGCLQSVLYGFAGLRVVEAGGKAEGTKIAGDGEAALFADPRLPPGWAGLTVKGVQFRGKSYTVAVGATNKATVTLQ